MFYSGSSNLNQDVRNELNKFLYDASQKYTQMDFYRKLVEFQNDPNGNVSGQSSYLLAAPPTLDGLIKMVGTDDNYAFDALCTPLGGVSNFNNNETNNLMPIGELGSTLMRMAPSDATYSLNLGRLFTYHSNLKYAVYKWLFHIINVKGSGVLKTARAPGPNGSSFLAGLESDIYGTPFGIIAVHCDAAGNFVGSDFFEMCFMNNYGKGFQSQSVVIIDNASCYVCAVVPVLDGSGSHYNTLRDGAIAPSQVHDYSPKA